MAEYTQEELIEKLKAGEIPEEAQAYVNEQMAVLGEKFDPKVRVERAKNLLESKYDGEFKIMVYRGQQIADRFFTVNAYNTEFPETVFEAKVGIYEDILDDSYVMRRICKKMEDALTENALFHPDRYRIYVESSIKISYLTDVEMSYTELPQKFPGNRYNVSLFVVPGSEKTGITAETVKELFKGFEAFSGKLNIYSTDLEQYRKAEEYLNSFPRIYHDFTEMMKPGLVGSYMIKNGQIVDDDNTLGKKLEEFF